MAQGHATHTAEGVFLSGIPREDEQAKPHDTVNRIGRDLFALHGMVQKVTEQMKAARAEDDRGAKDYADNERELRDMLFQAMKLGASGGYHEAPKGEPAWTKWMVTVCGMLAVAGVGSAVGMYGKLSAIEANQISQQKQIDYLTQLIVRRTP